MKVKGGKDKDKDKDKEKIKIKLIWLKVDEAVVVLRRSLAEAEAKSVTIVTVGFLTNIRSSFLSRLTLSLQHNAIVDIMHLLVLLVYEILSMSPLLFCCN